jgi:NAD-dependent deacetylase
MDFRRLRKRGPLTANTDAAALAEFLRGARRGVVFTGAGISTESGIPDFRSPGGIWTKNAPIEYKDFLKSAEMRREAWRRRFATEEVFGGAQPNDGHKAIAELVARGMVASIITQNIDNLHQASGVPPELVIEIHGNTRYARCLSCGARTELEPIRARFEAHGDSPDCAFCGGLLKTATISFRQSMPEAEMERAQDVTLACDVFLVLGSSLVVYPAAGFPALAKEAGARLAIVNRDPTELDGIADLVLHTEIGPVMRDALVLL